jgi:two-component system response regulator AgrA
LKDKGYNGFTLAKEIRKLDTRGFLIFVTTYEELMFETFKYRLEAMSYLIKDDPAKLRGHVEKCLHNIQELIRADDGEMRKYYTLSIADSTYQIPMDEIIYFETSNQYHHRVVLHTEKRILEFRGNLNGIEGEVGEGFLRVHRSYLVQVSKIQQVNYTENMIQLEKGNVCRLARNARQKLKACLLH